MLVEFLVLLMKPPEQGANLRPPTAATVISPEVLADAHRRRHCISACPQVSDYLCS